MYPHSVCILWETISLYCIFAFFCSGKSNKVYNTCSILNNSSRVSNHLFMKAFTMWHTVSTLCILCSSPWSWTASLTWPIIVINFEFSPAVRQSLRGERILGVSLIYNCVSITLRSSRSPLLNYTLNSRRTLATFVSRVVSFMSPISFLLCVNLMALDSRMCIQDQGKHLNEWNFSSEKLTTFLLSFSSRDKQFGFFLKWHFKA